MGVAKAPGQGMTRPALCLLFALALGGCEPAQLPPKSTPAEIAAATIGTQLHDYDRDVLAAVQTLAGSQRTPDERNALTRGTMLNEPATREDIKALEKRIGHRLPPSYRQFLLTSNGMLFHGGLNTVTMLPAGAVEPLSAKNYPSLEQWVGMSDVAIPLDAAAGGPLPGPALAHAWVISSVQDGDVYLILPELARPDGEWPVWFLGAKSPGAIAYGSFGAMLARERAAALEELRQRRSS